MPTVQVRDHCKSAAEVAAISRAVRARIAASRLQKPVPVLVVAAPEPKPTPVKPAPKPISLSLVVRLSPGFKIVSDGEEPRPIIVEHSVNRIIRMVAETYGISVGDILSQRRHMRIVYARQLAMYVARLLTTQSTPQLGVRFGGRDHTTILHAIKKMEALYESDLSVAQEIDNLIQAATNQ